MKKPTKTLIYLNAFVVPVYLVAAVLYFLADKDVFGVIWLAGAVIWGAATFLQYAAYRTRVQTYDMVQRRWPS